MPKRKEVWYVAHPVSDDPETHVRNTIEWLRWLEEEVPERVFIAPWVALVQAYFGREVPEEVYQRALADDCEVVRRCDGVLLVGGRISRGMAMEAAAAQAANLRIIDMSPTRHPPSGFRESLLAREAILMG